MAEELNTSLLQKDDSASPDRTRLSEVGYIGLKTAAGQVLEESNRKLRFPAFIKEVDEMMNDATIATGMQFVRMMLSRVKWKVEAPNGATDSQKEKAKFIETCMHDMEHTWQSFITEVTNYIPYGFQVHEKVFRKRLKTAGSKFNDGLVGWRKLPVRSQNTIAEWKFSEDGRDILGLKQSTRYITSATAPYINTGKDAYIDIPRQKFLLFTSDSRLGDPTGRSPLKAVWQQWRYRQELEKLEAIGVGRDLGGIPTAYLPSAYMSADASPDKKAVFDMIKKITANLHQNAQSGLALPSDVDPETKQKLFDFKLLSSDSASKYNTSDLIKRINTILLIALNADVLAMGSDKVGSFSLAGAKTSLSALMLEYRLREIQDVINNDLIPHTFRMNGWTDTEFPEIRYTEFDEVELEELSKFVQRIASQGLIVKDLETINIIRKAYGAEPLPPDTDVNSIVFTDAKSRSGDGLAAGAGNGTSDSVATTDTSVSNLEN